MPTLDSGQKIDAVNDGGLRIEYENGRLIVNDGATNVLLLGKNNEGRIKVRLAQEGYDVLTSTDQHVIFDSDFNLFKIVDNDVVTLNKGTNSSNAESSVLHGQSNVPAVIAFTSIDGVNYYQCPLVSTVLTGTEAGKIFYTTGFYVTSTEIIFFMEAPNVSGSGAYQNAFTVFFKYYILQETAA